MIKIKAKTTTKIATETTEMTKTTPKTPKTTVNSKDIATSTRKRIASHRSIQTRNRQEQKRPTKASSMTVQIDASTITLRNGLSSTSLSVKKEVIKT